MLTGAKLRLNSEKGFLNIYKRGGDYEPKAQAPKQTRDD